MVLPFADIHAVQLSTFGEPGTLRQPGQADQTVTVIWKARGFQVDAEGETTVSSAQPAIGLEEEGLAQKLAKGDQIVIRGATYTVWDVDRNGEGWARCPLHKVAA